LMDSILTAAGVTVGLRRHPPVVGCLHICWRLGRHTPPQAHTDLIGLRPVP
jgi:hypothetical protein